MKTVPFDELERFARERYAQKMASIPEPKVINARPLATLDAPRSFIWGGVGYWAPPLSYESGIRLMIAANALRDLRKGGGPQPAMDAAKFKAARMLRAALRCRRPLWRWWSRAFFSDPAEHVEGVIRWLLEVEDEAPVIPTDQPVTVDLIDNLYTFQEVYRRRPYSWRDYVYGMRHIGRSASRADLREAVNARMGVNSDEKGWTKFEREMRAHAGWVN